MPNSEFSIEDNGFTLEVDENQIVITIPVNGKKDLGPSKSGKTIKIASSGGNKEIILNSKESVYLGLNLYKYGVKKG